jgi:hypothetical protein
MVGKELCLISGAKSMRSILTKESNAYGECSHGNKLDIMFATFVLLALTVEALLYVKRD